MVQQLTSPGDMRRVNRHALLQILWSGDIRTAGELVELSGLTRATVYSACDELIESGWIVELDRQRAPGEALGRPSRRFAFAHDAAAVLTIDAGSYSVRVAVADLLGTQLAMREAPLSGDTQTIDERHEQVDRVITQVLDDADVLDSSVVSVTLGIPAPVNRSGEVPIRNTFWATMHAGLPQRLRERFDAPVHVENDANLAALAELAHWRLPGDGSEVRNLLAVLSGWRSQSGIIAEGQLIRGWRGRAGESSGLSLVKGVGNTIGAYQWVAEEARIQLRETATPSLLRSQVLDGITSAEVIRLSKQSDLVASKAVKRCGQRLGKIIASLVSVLDPEVVVICGSAVHLARETMQVIQAEVARVVDTDNVPSIECSSLGEQVVLVGGIARSLDHVRADCERISLVRRGG